MVTRVEKYSSKVGQPRFITSIWYRKSFTRPISNFLYSYNDFLTDVFNIRANKIT